MTDPVVDVPQPWLAEALEQLDLRRNDRVLVFSAPTMAHVAAVKRSIGRGGRTVVIEPDRDIAERIADEIPHDVEVLNYMPEGDESFGDFDAMLACPLHTLQMPTSFWGRLFSHNLRPGGRFVLDLPGEDINEHLATCWDQCGGDYPVFDAFRGPSKQDLARELRAAGLRNVTAAAATHMVHFENGFALSQLLHGMPGADADDSLLESFGRALIERLQTPGEIELAFHRTRVHGLH